MEEQTPPEPEEDTKQPTILEEVRAERALAEKTLAELKQVKEDLVELKTQDILGGSTEAGSQPPPKETEDEQWAREAKVRYEGTGMDPT